MFRPDVLIINSLGGVLPLFRYNSSNADDFTVVHTEVIKPLAKSGAAVLVVDHLAKNADSRQLGPTGTVAKSRAVGGLAVRMTAEETFKPGEGGAAKLELHEDRHGGARKLFPKSTAKPVIGTFTLRAEGEALTYTIDHALTVPMRKQKDIDAEQLARDVAQLRELRAELGTVSVRSARKALTCGRGRAQRAVTEVLVK